MVAGPSRDQIIVYHDVFVGVDGTHVHHVAEQIVVGNHLPPAHQLRHRGGQPQTVADDALDNILHRKSTLEEFGGGGELLDVFGVTEAVGNHPGRNDDGGKA